MKPVYRPAWSVFFLAVAGWCLIILAVWLVGCAQSSPREVVKPLPTPSSPPPPAATDPVTLCGDGVEGQLKLQSVGKDRWMLCNGKDLVACPTEEGKAYALWDASGLRCIEAKPKAEPVPTPIP